MPIDRFTPLGGMAFMLAIAFLFSTDRRLALRRWRLIVWGLALQFGFALIVLKSRPGEVFFRVVNDAFVELVKCTEAGARFVFGRLAAPDTLWSPDDPTKFGVIFGAYVLPTIIFFSCFSAVLYHLGIMQKVVKAIAWVMAKTMGTSGAETLSAAANIFVGQTEAPLMIRPFIPNMTYSELMAVMTGGLATIAGGVMAAYVVLLSKHIPNIAGHLLAASAMSAPAALLFAKIMVPETGQSETAGTLRVEMKSHHQNAIDAAAAGASEGMSLAINVAAMLIAFLALIALFNSLLVFISPPFAWIFTGKWEALEGFSLEFILGTLLRPFAWLNGVPWGESQAVGELMGVKTVANEFVGYLKLADMSPDLSARSRIIATYALCGFSNFGSIGILLGGLTILAPQRRGELARLAMRALVAGTFASNMTACIAAMLLA